MLDRERGSIGILCVRRMDMISGPRESLARISLLLGGLLLYVRTRGRNVVAGGIDDGMEDLAMC